jgi:N-acetylneuraminic acid mutarotase
MSNIPFIVGQRTDARVGRFGIQSLQSALSMAFQDGGGTWTKKADMPTRRFNLSASTVNGKIYAIGGYSADPPGGYTSIVEEYDPAQDKWSRKTDMPTRRSLLHTCAVNGKIYAIGGTNDDSDLLSVVEEYDPGTDTWTRKADMLVGRFDEGEFVISVDGRIYAIGGTTRKGYRL